MSEAKPLTSKGCQGLYRKEEFLNYLKAKGYSLGSFSYITCYLEQFYFWLLEQHIPDIKEVTPQIIQDYQLHLTHYKTKEGKNLSPLTILSKLSTLKRYFNYLQKQRLIFLEPTLDLKLPKVRDYLPRNILTQTESEHFLSLPNLNTPFGLRDKAILELLYSSGIRRAELCNLDLYDIDLKDRTLHIRESKNKKDRIIPLGKKAKEAIEKYLIEACPKLSKDPKEKALFLSQYGRRLLKTSLNYIIKKYSRQMRLDKKITPHSLRHSCATHLLQNGANLVMIQRLLGHTRLDSTQIYTRIAPCDLKEAIRKYHPRERIKKIDSLKKSSILSIIRS